MIIHWFRRDLRLHDNPALHAALQASAGRVIPLVILDERLLASRRVGPAQVAFLLDCLRALDVDLRQHGQSYPAFVVDHAERRERAADGGAG